MGHVVLRITSSGASPYVPGDRPGFPIEPDAAGKARMGMRSRLDHERHEPAVRLDSLEYAARIVASGIGEIDGDEATVRAHADLLAQVSAHCAGRILARYPKPAPVKQAEAIEAAPANRAIDEAPARSGMFGGKRKR